MVMVVYYQTVDFDFIIYDDPNYAQDNPRVNRGFSWEGIVWSFTTFHSANWHPLTWLSLMLDGELYGGQAGGYHWTNVLFHLANTLLLFLVFHGMTGALWRSGFVAALFAVHPLHVESVAWVAERKDVLSGFFWMVTLGFYWRYVKSPSLGRYGVMVASFVLGLMSKPMVVTLPLVLLLLDFWPLRRFERCEGAGQRNDPGETARLWAVKGRSGVAWRMAFNQLRGMRLFMEKIPLLCFSLISGILTLYAQKAGGALLSFDKISLSERVANAFVSYAAYLFNTIWPVNLALLYPHPKVWPLRTVILSFLTFVMITIFVLRSRREHDFLKTGWLWYLITMLPVIGIVQVGNQAMADRYTYLPLIGVFIMIVWLCPARVTASMLVKTVLTVATVAVLLVMTATAHRQASLWRNSETILGHSLEKTRGNYEAANNLGVVYFHKGRYDQAAVYLERAIDINPGFAVAYNNLGQVRVASGDVKGGIALFRKGLQIRPDLKKMRRNLAAALLLAGDFNEAADLYHQLVRENPKDADLFNDLGAALAESGKIEEARLQFQRSLLLKPTHEAARHNLKIIEEKREHNARH